MQTFYIKRIKSKFNVPNSYIADMLGVKPPEVCRIFKRLGIKVSRGRKYVQDEERKKWNQFINATTQPNEDIESRPAEINDVSRQMVVDGLDVSFYGKLDIRELTEYIGGLFKDGDCVKINLRIERSIERTA